ncbi:hypothetical protein [Caudoviricetes sp.]|nr:hypothetical protein [Caudoviricetes sp.]
MDSNYFEESLKRRIAAAKAAGWTDSDIERSSNVERAVFNRKFQQEQFNKQQADKKRIESENAKKPSGLKRFLVNTGALIGSTGASIAGGIFAAPTGGASLAGAAGAAAGIEALRRKLLGEKQSAGASIVEGALTALPGAVAVKGVAKTAKAVDLAADTAKAAKAVTAAERTAEIAPKVVGSSRKFDKGTDAFKTVFKAAPEETKVTRALFNKGTDVRGNVRGVFAGATDKGVDLGVRESRKINKTIDTLMGKTPKTAKQQLTIVERERRAVGKQISDSVMKDNVLLDNPRRQKLADNIQKKLANVADFDPNKKSHVDLYNTLVKQIDAEDLVTVEKGRKNLDKIAKSAYKESDATTQFKARVADAIRSGVDNLVTDISPVSKDLKRKYRDLIKAENYMTKEKVLRPKGARTHLLQFGEGKGIGGGTTQVIRDYGGRKLQGVANKLSTPAMREFAKQYGIRLLAGRPSLPGARGEPLQPVPDVPDEFTPQNVFTNPQSDDEAILNEVIASGASDFDTVAKGYADIANQIAATGEGGDVAVAEGEQSPFGFTREDLINAAYQAVQAGDYKGLKNIKDLDQLLTSYETSKAKALEASGEGGKLELSDKAIDIVNSLQGGLSDIDRLEETLTANPNVTGNFAGLMASKPFGFTINEQAAAVQAQIDRVKQVIGKALEGGVLRKEDEEKYKKILPTVRDPQSVALSKIAELRRKLAEDLKNYVTLQSTYGKGAADITNMFSPANANIFNTEGAY